MRKYKSHFLLRKLLQSEVLSLLDIDYFLEPEFGFKGISDVLLRAELNQHLFYSLQFPIQLIVQELQDGDAVGDLQSEGVD